MKRLHVSLTVNNIDASVQFYSHLFAAHPTVQRNDYAKWLLDDPRVNFSIIGSGGAPGLNHLGIQADTDTELNDIHLQMQKTQGAVSEVAESTCCYARGKKGWATDPQGIAWEAFLTSQDGLETFGETTKIPLPQTAVQESPAAGGCCA